MLKLLFSFCDYDLSIIKLNALPIVRPNHRFIYVFFFNEVKQFWGNIWNDF